MFEEPSDSFPLGLRVLHDGERVLTRCLWKSTVAEVGVFGRDDHQMGYLVALRFPDGCVTVIGEHATFSDAYASLHGGRAFDPGASPGGNIR